MGALWIPTRQIGSWSNGFLPLLKKQRFRTWLPDHLRVQCTESPGRHTTSTWSSIRLVLRSRDSWKSFLPGNTTSVATPHLKPSRLEAFSNVIDFESGWKVDFIIRKDREFSVTEFGRRRMGELLGFQLFVASAEDVILAKLEWARMSDSERQIRDVAGILRTRGR